MDAAYQEDFEIGICYWESQIFIPLRIHIIVNNSSLQFLAIQFSHSFSHEKKILICFIGHL